MLLISSFIHESHDHSLVGWRRRSSLASHYSTQFGKARSDFEWISRPPLFSLQQQRGKRSECKRRDKMHFLSASFYSSCNTGIVKALIRCSIINEKKKKKTEPFTDGERSQSNEREKKMWLIVWMRVHIVSLPRNQFKSILALTCFFPSKENPQQKEEIKKKPLAHSMWWQSWECVPRYGRFSFSFTSCEHCMAFAVWRCTRCNQNAAYRTPFPSDIPFVSILLWPVWCSPY